MGGKGKRRTRKGRAGEEWKGGEGLSYNRRLGACKTTVPIFGLTIYLSLDLLFQT